MAYPRSNRAGRKPATMRRPTTYKRKPTYNKAPYTARTDGQSLLVSGYVEVKQTLKAATEGAMAYTIACDPKHPVMTLSDPTTGAETVDGAWDGAAAAAKLVNNKLTLPKFVTMQQLFNQYQVRSVTITVRVDAECGTNHRLVISNDTGSSSIISSMQSALSAAHKEFSLTDSKRECKYTLTLKGQQRDWFSTNTNQDMAASELSHIKVYQKLPKGTAQCEHQVTVTFNLGLKDSKNLVPLN